MTPTLQDQLAHETNMMDLGSARFEKATTSAEEKGQVHETTYGGTLMKAAITPVAEGLTEFCNETKAGRNARIRPLLQASNHEKVAFLALQVVFGCFTHEETILSMASARIGQRVEDELKFQKFSELFPDYYDKLVTDFKRRGTTNYRHLHRVFTQMSNKKGVEWEAWTPQEKIEVGAAVINVILERIDMVERVMTRKKNKTTYTLCPTPEALDWINRHKDHMALLSPDFLPTIIEPVPWTDRDQGGFYSPQVRSRCQLVKARRMTADHKHLLDTADMPGVYEAVNTIQAVPWQINTSVHEVMRAVWASGHQVGMPRSDPYEIPPAPISEDADLKTMDVESSEYKAFMAWKAEAAELYSMEKERRAQCFSITRVMRMANDFSEYSKFWFVHNLDFRGRVYAMTSGLSPQGTDIGKGLLRFAKGKVLGKEGLYWLQVHGANKYGFDKASYDGRVQWVQDNRDAILGAAADPMGNTSFWGGADKPWQFLAFCFEFANTAVMGENTVSYLPVSLDGSCNGLQNFSAILRDSVGGRSTNLLPSDEPADIYSDVGDVCYDKLKQLADTDTGATQWISFFKTQCSTSGFPRKLAKKPVMTLPYGSTRQACTTSIFRFIMEIAPKFFDKPFQAALYLTPLLWDSIGEVVIAAREAMDYLRDVSKHVSAQNQPVVWTTPLGLPVYQRSPKTETYRIRTHIGGDVRLKVRREIDMEDTRKAKQGSAPNLVHSVDATHLMMTVNRAAEMGMTDFAVIHDDFGVHACDTPAFHTAIREAFVELHRDNAVLEDFRSSCAILAPDAEFPPMPEWGDLDINGVIDSPYFFG